MLLFLRLNSSSDPRTEWKNLGGSATSWLLDKSSRFRLDNPERDDSSARTIELCERIKDSSEGKMKNPRSVNTLILFQVKSSIFNDSSLHVEDDCVGIVLGPLFGEEEEDLAENPMLDTSVN